MFRRRRHGERVGLADGWETILDQRSAQWRVLDVSERSRLAERADWLLRERRWEAARDFVLTDEVRTLISAHAALLVLELDETWYAEVGTIIVREGSMEQSRFGGGRGVITRAPGLIDGEAHHDDGPLMVSWEAARREAASPRWGRDVVLHEFAHKIDMLDGTLDGTPHLDDANDIANWVKICTNYFEAVREGTGPTILRQYAGTNAAEFFAVATETFFTRPVELREHAQDLFEILRRFYRQDPAVRLERAIADGRAAAPVAPRILTRTPKKDSQASERALPRAQTPENS